MPLSLRERRDRFSLYLFYALFSLLPVTVVFGHRGVAPWLLIASLPAFARGDFWQTVFGGVFDRSDWREPTTLSLGGLVFFCFWIFVSGAWSPQHDYGLSLYVFAPALVGASVIWFSLNISKIWAYRLAFAFALSIAGGMTVLAFEGVNGGMLRGALPPSDTTPDRVRDIISLGRGVTALAPALFPAAIIVAMIWGRFIALVVFGLGILAAINNDVAANVVAITIGLAAAAIAFKAPRAMLHTLRAGLIVLLVAAPFAVSLPVDVIYARAHEAFTEPQLAALASSLHRLAIWKYVGGEIGACLPFGCGADYARAIKESAGFVDVPGALAPVARLPLHPHNMFLQIWLELGFIGAAAIIAFIWFAGEALLNAKLPTPVIAAIIGAVTAIALSITTEGSLWQVWRLAAMALAGMGVALAFKLHQYGWRDDR